MKRTVDEWIGRSPDDWPPPAHVRQRILDHHDWKCYRTGTDLRRNPRNFDHVKALCNGGENRESNIAPIWAKEHKVKTAEDVSEKGAADRKVRHHYGLEGKSKAKIAQRPKPPKLVTREPLPYRPMYVDCRSKR